jgi:hypothetical protein
MFGRPSWPSIVRLMIQKHGKPGSEETGDGIFAIRVHYQVHEFALITLIPTMGIALDHLARIVTRLCSLL